MRYFIVIVSLFLFYSCGKQGNIDQFKTGTFKTHLDESDINSIAYRNDSIQIETYNNVKDTFAVKWTSNFEYELLKLNPKTQLDSTPFIVKITGIKENSYSFTAHFKGSDFKQKGTAVKVGGTKDEKQVKMNNY
ncbi:DNA topoisomerase IV [Aureibaculum sp. 2210JD6-5]|uniref:DNA topoisomerase IV n=1 Tax=Aureibaculum sp. 2210JD6-5 TaxID=3103957 RepID=UPI002AAD0AFD|nr:DNA topoisomerase IV [Aureibaculum sp. 2210JD6-5]MDY7396105.1 DNA topoisomerase IV [Aureibaculum sp. 2210JD6-5]